MYAVAAYHKTLWVYNVWYFNNEESAVKFMTDRTVIQSDWQLMPLLQEVQA